MLPILFKDSANREQKQQACLYVLPRCCLFYSKIVQIESKTKSSKLDFAVFPNRSIKVVKVLKIPPPSKKTKAGGNCRFRPPVLSSKKIISR